MQGVPLTNSPLSSLISSVVEPLLKAGDAAPAAVSVALLYQGQLADSSQIFIVRDDRDRALAIVQLSSEAAPQMVARGVSRARSAAQCLGAILGRSVLLPLSEGDIEGRSYAVMPFCRGFSNHRWGWRFERVRLRPLVIRWLHEVASKTRTQAAVGDIDRRFRRPLELLLAVEGASPTLRASVGLALKRLAQGEWVPCHVLMHGDVWKGNLLLRLPSQHDGRPSFLIPWADRLAVIDWAGAQPAGYGFFDLVRASESLHFGAARLRVEVRRHCEVLGCEPVDASAYLLCAVGAILENIEEFPLPRLLRMAESNLQDVLDAVGR